MNASEVEHLFTYHAPTLDQTLTYNEVTQAFLKLALDLQKILPNTPEAAQAFSLLHMARMQANASIALKK